MMMKRGVATTVAVVATVLLMLLSSLGAVAQFADSTGNSPILITDSLSAHLPDSATVQPDSSLRRAMRPFSLTLPGSKEHTPKGATIRSLILPGWGQAYNR